MTHPDPSPLHRDEGELRDAAEYPSFSRIQRSGQPDAMYVMSHYHPTKHINIMSKI